MNPTMPHTKPKRIAAVPLVVIPQRDTRCVTSAATASANHSVPQAKFAQLFDRTRMLYRSTSSLRWIQTLFTMPRPNMITSTNEPL